jgi:hypothetical protein
MVVAMSSRATEIEWVNHASFIVRSGDTSLLRTFGPSLLNNNGRTLGFRLLMDPWLIRRALDRFVLRAS